MTQEKLLRSLQWRYAVKAFDPAKKIDPVLWDTLETALQLTPSSYGLQPWKFLVVEDLALRARLRAASWNQKQVTDCSHFVVLTHHPEVTESDIDRFLGVTANSRKVPRETLAGYRNVILGDVMGPRKAMLAEWTARQCYIALGNFMTSAALLGVDTCPMEGLDPGKYDEILGLNETRFRTVVACAAGFRSTADRFSEAPKIRYPKAEIFERR
jgi:nitroreductase